MSLAKKIIEEYDKNILSDSEEMYRLKEAIDKLSDLDKTLLILYSDCGSMRKTAKLFHVSDYTIWSRIAKIRKQLFDILNPCESNNNI